MARSLQIATFASTAVRLHWTFVLFVAGIIGAIALVLGFGEALRYGALILAMFACVVLHEFGHIRVARIFGIHTPEVMLLPIGGLAKLERIPEEPREELAIAIAGPMVNFTLFAALALLPGVGPDWKTIAVFGWQNVPLIDQLAIFNLLVGLFNLLPAFPMDGGRILRASLAYVMPHHRATMIAAKTGQVIAIGMVVFGFYASNIMLIIIGAFIFLAARSEAHVDAVRHAIGGTPITRVMVSGQPRLEMSDPLGKAAEAIIETDNDEFPVFDREGHLVGILVRNDVLEALENQGPSAPVNTALKTEIRLLCTRARAEDAAELMENGAPAVGVVDSRGAFQGIVTWRNTLDVLAVRKALDRWKERFADDPGKPQ